MNKRKIIIIIISLIFVSFLLFFLLKPKTKILSPLGPKISPTEIPWQIYSNQDYQYVISYPPDWKLEAWDIKEAANLKRVPDGSIWHQAKFKGGKENFEVVIWENKTKAPLRTWLTWFRHEDLNLKELPEKENFQIGGLPAILYSQQETARGPLDHIFFQQDDKIYEFIEEKKTDLTDKSAYGGMVSSFRFLEDEVAVKPKAQALVDLGKKDLSEVLGVKKDEIRLIQIEPVDWSDSSLGCPKEGMFYAQVITSGYKIALEGRGKSYIYHSDYRRVVSCQR